MPEKTLASVVSITHIQQRIFLVRGQRVIPAADLARIYGVPVRQLNQAVRRNADRFPEDFVFQLNQREVDAISRSQFVILNEPGKSKSGSARAARGSNLKYLPYAFTEHGVLMAANVLKNARAARASVYIVRAFFKLRELLSTHHQLAEKLAELERKLQNHDDQILAIVDAIRQLMEEPEEPPKPPIGFATELARSSQLRKARSRTSSTAAANKQSP